MNDSHLPTVIGLAGKKGCGKTALAKELASNHGYVRLSFANPLKDIITHAMGWDDGTLDKLKTSGEPVTNQVSINRNRLSHLVSDALSCDVENEMERLLFSRDTITVRDILQIIGTDIIRNTDNRWFIKRLIPLAKFALAQGIPVVIDDVRFPNELCAIEEKLRGSVFYVDRPCNKNNSTHASENSLSIDSFDADRIIKNNADAKIVIDEIISRFKKN